MKTVVMNVNASADGDPVTYKVDRVVKDVASTPGEKVNPNPRIENIYTGTDRSAYDKARSEAKRAMY